MAHDEIVTMKEIFDSDHPKKKKKLIKLHCLRLYANT